MPNYRGETMAFKRKRKVYNLDFEGTEYEGLQVKVRGLTTGEYLELVSLSAPGTEGDKETEGMLRMFAEHLVSWNLEDDETDELVPTTYEGVKSNDFVMNMSIINAWTSAIASVPEKTEKKSNVGDLPLVASIPTETLQ
jgi:hypothetical protein